MAVKMPSPTLKKECATILESMKVCIILLHFIVFFCCYLLVIRCKTRSEEVANIDLNTF